MSIAANGKHKLQAAGYTLDPVFERDRTTPHTTYIRVKTTAASLGLPTFRV